MMFEAKKRASLFVTLVCGFPREKPYTLLGVFLAFCRAARSEKSKLEFWKPNDDPNRKRLKNDKKHRKDTENDTKRVSLKQFLTKNLFERRNLETDFEAYF